MASSEESTIAARNAFTPAGSLVNVEYLFLRCSASSAAAPALGSGCAPVSAPTLWAIKGKASTCRVARWAATACRFRWLGVPVLADQPPGCLHALLPSNGTQLARHASRPVRPGAGSAHAAFRARLHSVPRHR